MRLDKFLSDGGVGSRKEVKALIKKGFVQVNGQVIKSDKQQICEQKDQVIYNGQKIEYQRYFYYILNKPAGVISATEDYKESTVMDLFSAVDHRSDLFPVGRLDKDTEGLLVISNDGQLAHRLLSPKKHVEKEYFARVRGHMTEADVACFAEGFEIDRGERVLPARLNILAINDDDTCEISLVLHEGKYHQVKRMVKAVGKEVIFLKRTRMGGFSLPEALKVGDYRPMTVAEIALLEQRKTK